MICPETVLKCSRHHVKDCRKQDEPAGEWEPEKTSCECSRFTKQICNCDIMYVRAALALFGMGGMKLIRRI